ncbi:hypothetical protein SAMN05216359_110175 [Roseateles sp. YR242]|uniref:hypothetical protein n=1 Tax=Roseateles sp. YR242 TaxID=1855305 RepID=UPI0008B59F5C|nr:hypothetical protein [Roseateles sp. YR242]SEL52972.1 hypothetical protein SAMN05216359_110175 [Roseateles sp. YR242]
MPLEHLFSANFLSGYVATQDASVASDRTSSPTEDSVQFDPVRHGTAEQFALSREFIDFTAQVLAVFDRLSKFADQHRGDVDPQRIDMALKAFAKSILGVDQSTGQNARFGDQAGRIYSAGKELLDRIGRAMADEQVPLSTRLRALQTLTQDVDVCADGVMLHLSQCLQAIDPRHGGLMNSALRISNDLMHEAMLKVIRQAHAEHLQRAPADELHFLAGMAQAIFPHFGRTPPSDRLARHPTTELQWKCITEMEHAHQPSNLALALADQARGSLEDALSERLHLPVYKLHQSFEFNTEARAVLESCVQALEPSYGELPLDVLVDWRENGDQYVARLHNNPMLLGLHLLQSLEKLGAVKDTRSEYSGIVLFPTRQRHQAATLWTRSGNLHWVQEHGQPRGVCIDDLSGLPRQASPVSGLPWALDLPTLARRLTQIAIQNAWPDELADVTSSLLLDAAVAGPLIRGMDDVSLQAWLRREGPRLTPIQHHWLQEELVTQDRSDLLSLAALREWSLRSLDGISQRLWNLAISMQSEPILRSVGDALVHVSQKASVEAHRVAHSEPGTPGTFSPVETWLLRCFTSHEAGGDPPFSIVLHKRPALAEAALEVMLKVFQTGALSRVLLRGLVAGWREDDTIPLGIRLCLLPSAEPLERYLDLLEMLHDRIGLSAEELAGFFSLRGDGISSGLAVAALYLDHQAPLLLMGRLSTWLQQQRFRSDQWMDLMTMPNPPPGEVPYNNLAPRLMAAEPRALELYLRVAVDNFKRGLIDKLALRALLLTRPNDVPGIASLPSHLTLRLELEAPAMAAATQRLRLFMDTLLELGRHGQFTQNDLLDLLAEPESGMPHPWGAVGQLPPDQSQVVEAGFTALIGIGALLDWHVDALLQGEDPHLVFPDPAPAQPSAASP